MVPPHTNEVVWRRGIHSDDHIADLDNGCRLSVAKRNGMWHWRINARTPAALERFNGRWPDGRGPGSDGVLAVGRSLTDAKRAAVSAGAREFVLVPIKPPVHTKRGRRALADQLESIAADVRAVFGQDAWHLVEELSEIADELRG